MKITDFAKYLAPFAVPIMVKLGAFPNIDQIPHLPVIGTDFDNEARVKARQEVEKFKRRAIEDELNQQVVQSFKQQIVEGKLEKLPELLKRLDKKNFEKLNLSKEQIPNFSKHQKEIDLVFDAEKKRREG